MRYVIDRGEVAADYRFTTAIYRDRIDGGDAVASHPETGVEGGIEAAIAIQPHYAIVRRRAAAVGEIPARVDPVVDGGCAVGRSRDTLHGKAATTGIIGEYVDRDWGRVEGDEFVVGIHGGSEKAGALMGVALILPIFTSNSQSPPNA